MRRILLFTRNGISAIASVAKRASYVALTAGVIATVGASQDVQAQYPLYAASNANFSVSNASYNGTQNSQVVPASSSVMNLGDAGSSSGAQSNVVDSVFRGSRGGANVKSASYTPSEAYQQLCAAECSPGYGPDASCNISYYFNYDALWLRREGSRRFSLTQNTFMDNPDFEWGGRYTVGKMCDCVNAYEFVYAGPFRWTRTSDVSGAGNINSRFAAFPTTLADGFNGANRHYQQLKSDLDSFELNRRWWAWDAISTLVGIRYLRYEDNYSLYSIRPGGGPGPINSRYRDDIKNDMVGLQIGGDVYMPTSLRTLISFKGKAGAYANFNGREVQIINDATTSLRNAFDDVNIAGLIELGANGIYQVTPSVRLNAGYEAWLMPGVATVSRQRPNFLNAGSGTAIRSTDTIAFHGFSFGAQVLY